MSQFGDGNVLTGISSAAIAQHLRVKLTAGELAVAGAGGTDEVLEIGTIPVTATAQGEQCRYRSRNASGSTKMVAGGVIAVGVAVYGAAGGKILTTVAGDAIGVSLEAAAADGDVIEVLRR
jgi:hypothetical protein